MWFSRAGRITAWIALGAAAAGCGEKRLDVCKAVRSGDALHPVHLADSPDNGARATFRVAARPLPVLTIAADGIYLDHRPLLASWPEARCQKFDKTLAPRDQPSVAREQLVVPLDHWKLPNWAEADPDAIRPLGLALQWTYEHLERGMPEKERGVTLRIDRDAPLRLVVRVVRSVPAGFWNANGMFATTVAHGMEEVAFGGPTGGRWYSGPCDWMFETVIAFREPGVSVLLCDGALQSAGPACQCVLDSQTTPGNAVLRRILAVDAGCRPPERLEVTGPGDMRWSQLVAENGWLERVGVRAGNFVWGFWRPAPGCEVDTPVSRLRQLTASCALHSDSEFDKAEKQEFDAKVAELRRAAAQ